MTMRSKPALTASDCHKMMDACKAEAQKNKWNVAIAIVDDSGAALLLERFDGAGAISSEVAMGKAKTAALTKRPTKFFEDRIKERPAFVTFPTPGVMFQGGLPLMYQGECVGAIGVSGVQSHEDEQIAKAGADVLG
jgi:glc operon protein GlcG